MKLASYCSSRRGFAGRIMCALAIVPRDPLQLQLYHSSLQMDHHYSPSHLLCIRFQQTGRLLHVPV